MFSHFIIPFFLFLVSDEGIPRPLGGVPLYHAPELKEKAAEWDYEDTPIDEQLCLMTKASDIYALALVVTELVYPPMATLIEKELFLTDIKASRVFPTQGTVSTACIAQLVEMLNKDPKCRPDAKSIVSIHSSSSFLFFYLNFL